MKLDELIIKDYFINHRRKLCTNIAKIMNILGIDK